jgi:glycosyltransferase involved in cell wall biosynthesis
VLLQQGEAVAGEHGSPSAPRSQSGQRVLPISGFVICQDEEQHIEACLRSLSSCREIIVVDSGSSDGTLAIVEKLRREGLPIVLLQQAWLGYASQKQFALRHATQAWCLSLDADERLDDKLQGSLADLIAAEADVSGWMLKRLPSAMGDARPPPNLVYAKPILRLVRRGGAHFDESALVHEGLVVAGAVRIAKRGLIRHERRLPFDEQLAKELRYARLKATERVARGRRPSLLRLLFNPAMYFLRLFVFHRWFLCGRAGFVHAVTGAIYSFSAETMHFELHRSRR